MIEIKVRKIERYEVTRYSENEHCADCVTVASNLTQSQADDIAGAVYERARSAGKAVHVAYAGSVRLGDEPGASTTAYDDQFTADPTIEEEEAFRALEGKQGAVWNGEGIPSLGAHVLCRDGRSTRYTKCEVVFSSDYWVVVEALEGEPGSSVQDAIDVLDYHSFSRLRSVLTHEGKAMEAMIRAYRDSIADKTWQEGIRGLYTAILEGRIPGVKLEV